jgi:hypothetical protein
MFGEIDLRGTSEAKPRHSAQRVRFAAGVVNPSRYFQLHVGDLGEIAAFERIDARLDLRAQGFELEAIFSPTLLKDAQGVADGFTCVLVFAGVDNLLNEGILLDCQADVPGRHVGLAILLIRIRRMAKIANHSQARD